MAEIRAQRIALAARPHGEPRPENFRLEQWTPPEPAEGEVLVETVWLSLDPYMRGMMDDRVSYTTGLALGAVLRGDTVSRVLASRSHDLSPGDYVEAYTGWQTHAVVPATMLRKLDPSAAPLTAWLGVLGMPGLTAYAGLLDLGQPRPGETLVVAAATGPVGSLVAQIGRLKGCRVVAIAGGDRKRRYLEALGFEAALDHRDPDFAARLALACPDGVDVYFENVGGHVWRAVFPLLNRFARIPVCGLIAHYNDRGPGPGPDRTPELMLDVLAKRLTIRGFIVSDFEDRVEDFRREVGAWLATGKITCKEDVVEGLVEAPQAFIGLLKGENFGKLLVRVAPET